VQRSDSSLDMSNPEVAPIGPRAGELPRAENDSWREQPYRPIKVKELHGDFPQAFEELASRTA